MNNGININLELERQIEDLLRQAFGYNYQETLAIILAVGMILGVVLLIMFIINKVGDYLIFKKVGEAPHKCFIPYYSEYMTYNYAGFPLVYFLMWILPVIYYCIYGAMGNNNNGKSILIIVYAVVVLFIQAFKCFRISKRFGHGIGWAIGLFFLWPFFKLALGAGKSEYNKEAI